MILAHQQFQLDGKHVFVKAVLKPPFRLIAPMPNEACFYYVIRGKAAVITDSEYLEQNADEGIVLKCGNFLNEYVKGEDLKDECEAIAVHFHPDIIKDLYVNDLPNFALEVGQSNPVRYEKIKTTKLIKSYIASLQFYFENPELISDELIRLKLKEIILLLAQSDNAERIRQVISQLFTKAEIDFKSTIESNLYRNYSLEELASLCHFSLSTFKRQFSKHYNQSPHKYILERKLEKACKLLKGTELRVAHIAYDCGFSDPSHFSKCFQRAFNMSPTNFREK